MTASAGYSGTPLPKKLGIKDGARVAFIDSPEGFEDTLGPLPDGVAIKRQLRGPLDVVVFFTASRAKLERRIEKLRAALDPAGRLWVAWPKRASGVPTDVTEDVVREIALAHKLVDNKVAAIDATWSGLQLVIRLRDRQ
jgi:LPS O-antigen subunit length determinant protein (WzzB/FepE family)